ALGVRHQWPRHPWVGCAARATIEMVAEWQERSRLHAAGPYRIVAAGCRRRGDDANAVVAAHRSGWKNQHRKFRRDQHLEKIAAGLAHRVWTRIMGALTVGSIVPLHKVNRAEHG